MIHQSGVSVQIDRVHSGAICAEVAERLDAVLAKEAAGSPPHLVELIARLDRAEHGEEAGKSEPEQARR